MNSVCLVQSNVDSLPPPKSDPATLAQFPAVAISSPASPPPHSLPLADTTRTRLLRHPPTNEPATWLVDSTLSRWKSYRERLEDCRNKPDAESIHELRVATRRLISQLVLLDQVFPARKSEKIRKILKRQLESLGDLRDTHVQQIVCRKRIAKFPGLADLLAGLERRERALVRRASRKIVRFKSIKVENWVDHISEMLQRQFHNPRMRQEMVNIAVHRANEAFAEVIGRWRLIDWSDVRQIHRTRVAFKRFRYIVEVLPAAISGLGKRELRAMAWYQRKMGNLQDLEIVRACLDEFLHRHEGAEVRLVPFCRYLQRLRTRALRSFRKSVDQLFAFWRFPAGIDRRLRSPRKQPPTLAFSRRGL